VYISNFRRRVDAVFFVFVLFLLFCIIRLLFIQFFRSNYLASLAKKQHSLFLELEPRRGTIFDANFKPLAINVAADSIFCAPNDMKERDKERAIREMGSVLNLETAFLKDRLSRNKYFMWIERKVSLSEGNAVRKMNIPGIGFVKESRRSYPNSYLASHIIGFAGIDNTGLEGLEMYCNKILKGESGWAMYLRDARQNKLNIWESMVLPKDGFNIVLTIDEVIQYIAERELDKAYQKFNAKGASIVVMDPHTGAILALANRPTYNLDEAVKSPKDYRRNRAICDMFEPGSVFKIVTLAAALEEKKVNEEDRFFCENGTYRVSSHILHDHQPHGWLTFRQVIEESSNIGTTKVAQILGPDIIYKYVKLFGFGAKTGVDLPGEISGSIKEPRLWSKISIAAIPIGQEVGVTALQLASAVSVIANGGQLMRPFIIQEIRDKQGQTIKKFQPHLIRKVISLESAARAKKILIGVVEEGTGKLAKIDGITAAGKTGTAQKLEPNGTYSHNQYFASFIGFAPAEDPIVAIVVCVDGPHPSYFGGTVAAPVFKSVAADTIRYLKSVQPKSYTQRLTLNEISRNN
jgi:cell division protein FtsI/penicillin-binding protein 2